MKALLLCAGKGSRLKPLTLTVAKPLIPVANIPILYYILEKITAAGIEDIGIVVSPETGKEIQMTVGDGTKWNCRITYIIQSEPLGLAHAVKTAQDYLGDSSFLLFLGDNLIQDSITGFIKDFNEHSPEALILLKHVPDPHRFGVAELDTQGNIIRLVEKPKEPKTNLAVAGAYLFTSKIHESIARIKPSWRNELEITDAIQNLLDEGLSVRSHTLEGWWLDTGKRVDWIKANCVMLEETIKQEINCPIDAASRINGKVKIGKNSLIINSIITGPVSIAEDCQIKDSSIGPHTSIGPGVSIENSSIQQSIILGKCRIENIQDLRDSIIGRSAVVTHNKDKGKALRLFISDDAEVEVS